jgi:biopolymer transport protein ExbD
MAGAFGGGDEDAISGINVTPLVDVVLVLLVIFLMTAPVIYQSAIKVELPKARSGEAAQKSPLNLTLTKAGDLLWGEEQITWEILTTRLKTVNPEEPALISADQATAHGLVVKLMDTLRQNGVTKFALNVEGSGP